jgi:hypothetical protein
MGRSIVLSEPDLERELLRKGVSERAEAIVRCADCRRHPLTGETVHRYGRDWVCELCRPRRREEPTRSEPMPHVEHGISVRRLRLREAA